MWNFEVFSAVFFKVYMVHATRCILHSTNVYLLILQQYMGKKVVRGINCDQWRTCLQWAPLKSTFTLDYYFTGILEWPSFLCYPTTINISSKHKYSLYGKCIRNCTFNCCRPNVQGYGRGLKIKFKFKSFSSTKIHWNNFYH